MVVVPAVNEDPDKVYTCAGDVVNSVTRPKDVVVGVTVYPLATPDTASVVGLNNVPPEKLMLAL